MVGFIGGRGKGGDGERGMRRGGIGRMKTLGEECRELTMKNYLQLSSTFPALANSSVQGSKIFYFEDA